MERIVPRVVGFIAVALLVASPCVWAAAPEGAELRRTPVVEVFEKAAGAVVNIACTQAVEREQGATELFDSFFDFRSPLAPQRRHYAFTSVGSGFVVNPDGYVVTNAHVVMKAVDQRVIFVDGSEYKAQPVAIDSTSDLSVLKIQADRPLQALSLGRSDDLMIGETVISIGNPLGYHHTLTTGVVSALDRTLEFPGGVEYRGLIQTDAGINPGNSGGPLLNILGELIGVTTAIRGDAQNIGFAIPVDTLRDTLPRMLSLERLKRVKVGFHLGGSQTGRVTEVDPASPAARSGISKGDRLVRVDGRPLERDTDLCFHLLGKAAGSELVLEIERAGRIIPVSLTLEAIPIPNGAKLARQIFGLEIVPLKSDLCSALGLEGGLFIESVEAGSPAHRAGIDSGMIIVAMAGDCPRDLDQVGLLLEKVKSGDAIPLYVWDLKRYRGRLLIHPCQLNLTAR